MEPLIKSFIEAALKSGFTETTRDGAVAYIKHMKPTEMPYVRDNLIGIEEGEISEFDTIEIVITEKTVSMHAPMSSYRETYRIAEHDKEDIIGFLKDAGVNFDMPATQNPEQERLAARDIVEAGLIRRVINWGPSANNMTDEEKARVLNDILDQGEAQDKDIVPVRMADLKIVYNALREIQRLAGTDVREIGSQPREVTHLKGQINSELCMAMIHASQMFPHNRQPEAEDETPTI